jgi:hypothetical protein
MILDRFQVALAKGNALLTDHLRQDYQTVRADLQLVFQWQSQSLVLLQTVFGQEHVFSKTFERATTVQGYVAAEPPYIEQGMGVLSAAAENIARGWTWEYREILHAEVFDDFLEMAEHLLSGGYFVAAVVLAGATLEDHLRKLSQKHELPVVDSVAKMNEALRQQDVYPQSTWRSISSWYDLRTDAAHGKERDYAHQEVQLMISGVRDLISRYPA